MVLCLLTTPSSDPKAMESRVFRWACLYDHFHVVELLVYDDRIDLTTQDYFGLRVAIKQNRDIVVFTEACHYGQLPAVKYMLSDPRLLPNTIHTTIAEMTFIDTVCLYTMLEWEAKHNMKMESVMAVVKLVMTHPKFDLSDRGSRIFRWFCGTDDVEMVKQLLADRRVDASAKSSTAYFLANII
ncbi:hypothetical protein THRCLA_01519 [Thraustotheca clavata]|uniref:Uncharacterized protein n=1 Tax=Thraustotheca clavata TaxID=74557 RepID=A0A1W0A883_9STRA|nr:hypothetical protein THRCLA_01519 [Thraustotheca clavata]